MASSRRQTVARWGEDAAACYLEELGYRILARNVRFRHGELDLVAQDGDTIVFVEVKTRSSSRLGNPQDTVGARKQARIRLLAEGYLNARGYEGPCRFDVMAVRTFGSPESRIQHLVGVF